MRRSRPHAVLISVGRQCPLWVIRVDFGLFRLVRLVTGGVGASGLTGDQDEQCAKAGLGAT